MATNIWPVRRVLGQTDVDAGVHPHRVLCVLAPGMLLPVHAGSVDIFAHPTPVTGVHAAGTWTSTRQALRAHVEGHRVALNDSR